MKKTLKKFRLSLICIMMLSVLISLPASADKKVTMYSLDGRTISVSSSQVNDYKAVGWYDNIDDVRVTLYAKNKTIKVFKSQVYDYLKLGWYKSLSEITTTIYSPKGSAKVYNDEVNSYLSQGWSLTPVMLNNISSLPVKFTKKSNNTTDSLTLTYFYESAYYNSYNDTVELYYESEYEGDYLNLEIYCYDSKNNLLKSMPFYLNDPNIVLPGNTAWYMIKQPYSDYYELNGKYTHCKQVELYAANGKTMVCYDAQIDRNTAVGWKEKVKMYSIDGRSISVLPFKVDEYKKVGWYTNEGINFFRMENEYNYCIGLRDWAGAMDVVDEYMDYFLATEYESPAKQKKHYAMDKWRSSEKSPIVAESYVVSGDYKKSVEIAFRNISYKDIVAFRLTFDCYNVFNEKIESYHDYYYADDVYVPSGYSRSFCWDTAIYDNVKFVKNIRIYDIVFEDGSMA